MKRNALGRGLGALIREPEGQARQTDAGQAPAWGAGAAPARELAEGPRDIDIDLIDPSPFQPRSKFREEALEELARSIRAAGIIQPLVVRPMGSRFQLIAGERRWRAAQRAGLMKLLAIVRSVPDELALELTLVENIQREDLNPMEQARAFNRLMNEFHLTQEAVADRTGKDRASVANAIRLLSLDQVLQDLIEEGKLSAGHGRALLSVMETSFRMQLAKRAARGALTVRQVEKLAARRMKKIASAAAAGVARPAGKMDPNFRAALAALEKHLGTKVIVKPGVGKAPGQLILEYYDEAHLYGLYERLMGSEGKKAEAGG